MDRPIVLQINQIQFDEWLKNGVETFVFNVPGEKPSGAADIIQHGPLFFIKVPKKYEVCINASSPVMILVDEIEQISLESEELTLDWQARFKNLGEEWMPFQYTQSLLMDPIRVADHQDYGNKQNATAELIFEKDIKEVVLQKDQIDEDNENQKNQSNAKQSSKALKKQSPSKSNRMRKQADDKNIKKTNSKKVEQKVDNTIQLEEIPEPIPDDRRLKQRGLEEENKQPEIQPSLLNQVSLISDVVEESHGTDQ